MSLKIKNHPTLIRRPEVLNRCAFSSTTLHRLIRKKDFPPPVQLSPRTVAWVEQEVDDWIFRRISNR